MTTQYTVHPATLADAPAMAQIYIAAFRPINVNRIVMPPERCSNESIAEWLIERFHRQVGYRENRHFKLVDNETGKIVAYSRWQFPHKLTEDEKIERKREEEERERAYREGRKLKYPKGANVELADDFFGALDGMQEKYIDAENTYDVGLLAVDPAYQRKGLGRILLEDTLAKYPDKEDKVTYIEATAPGHPLYLKLGWEDVDLISIDAKRYGEEEPILNWVMLRQPLGKKIES